jgi:hypothetical protein
MAELCRKHDVLLICDEVATGFGRTGTMFAVEEEGVRPDFLCLAKGLSGGYLPLAATLTTDRVYEAFLGEFSSARTFFHGHTFTGNSLACAAALASLRLFETERVLERVRKTADVLRPKLAAIAELQHVGDVRQRGLMVGIELVRDRRRRNRTPTPTASGTGSVWRCAAGHPPAAARAGGGDDAAAVLDRIGGGAAGGRRPGGDRRGHRGVRASTSSRRLPVEASRVSDTFDGASWSGPRGCQTPSTEV